MKKQRKQKVPGIIRVPLLLVMLLASGWLVMLGISDIQTYWTLSSEVKANTQLLEATRAQQEKLEATKKNLTNPDYLEFVARGKYHVLREGEQVFVFPSLSEAQNGSPQSDADLGALENPSGVVGLPNQDSSNP